MSGRMPAPGRQAKRLSTVPLRADGRHATIRETIYALAACANWICLDDPGRASHCAARISDALKHSEAMRTMSQHTPKAEANFEMNHPR